MVAFSPVLIFGGVMSRDNTSKSGDASWQACRKPGIAMKTSRKIVPMLFLFTVVILSPLCHYLTHSEFYHRGQTLIGSLKNVASASNVSGSTQHSTVCPRLFIFIRPALCSSLMWCEIVEGARFRFLPTAPTHSRISVSVLQVPPGKQHEARRVKMLKRCGFDSALNAPASRSEAGFRKFDMFRIIIQSIWFCQVSG